MTKTYHDVEAVTRLLAEKEKDLELAAKIGQELLQRNKESEERAARLEQENQLANDTIIQLRHELQARTDLLHVYTTDLEDSSPMELRSANVEILQRKIEELEQDNKALHAEASILAQEAYQCEEKEEKLVKDAVQHLTQANYQIKDLHTQFTCKVDESSRQREEISLLLGQVCDLQSKVQKYSHENDDLSSNLRVYQETQDELTTELLDLKDKYREVVELLRDAQEDLRRSRKRTYPGMGKQTGMFSLPTNSGDGNLQAEIHSSINTSKKTSKADSRAESDTDFPAMGSSAYRKAARTFKAIEKQSRIATSNSDSTDTSKAVGGSVFQSYTISRENSFSPDEDEFEILEGSRKESGEISDDSGTGRSTGLSRPSSLASSAPKEEHARLMLRAATRNQRQARSQEANASVDVKKAEEDVEVMEVQTVGMLKPPTFQISSSLLHATPLGSVPDKNIGSSGHPSLGLIPGRTFGRKNSHSKDQHTEDSDFDETEPLGDLVCGVRSEEASVFEDMSSSEIPSSANTASSLAWDAWDTGIQATGEYGLGTIPVPTSGGRSGLTSLSSQGSTGQSIPSGHPGIGSIPGGHPGLGSVPSGHPGFRPTSGGHPGIGSIPGEQSGISSIPRGHPGIGSLPGGYPVTGSILGGHPDIGSIPGGHPSLGFIPGDNSGPSSISGEHSIPKHHPSFRSSPGLDTSKSYSVTMSQSMMSSLNTVSSVQPDLTSSWSGQTLHEAEQRQLSRVLNMQSKFNDSGVMSGEYTSDAGGSRVRLDTELPDIDAMSDGGFSDIGNYPGIRLPETKHSSEPLGLELEAALKHLNPEDVERRRKLIGRNYSYDLESDLGSPGLIAGVDEFFKSHLPYGVDCPVSETMEQNSSRSVTGGRNSVSSISYRNRRLPDKLRIVKPLEGSLTLHQWSRLATPHLGGVLEERVGVAVKGNLKHGLDPLFEMYQLSDLEEDDEESNAIPKQIIQAKTHNTLTISTVLHPDTTSCTNTYGRSQMSSGVPSRMSSRQSSRPGSVMGSYSDLPSLFHSPHNTLGLSNVLRDRKISGARRSQLDLGSVSNISSLTPSVLTSDTGSRDMSPTTPGHTPEESLPGSPDNKTDAGIVYGFFTSLKNAIYGQQRKEHRSKKQRLKMEDNRHKLRILEAVEEAGVDAIFSDKESTPLSMPDLTIDAMPANLKQISVSRGQDKVPFIGLSDFDARYLPALDDFDELADIAPGMLTLTGEAPRDPQEYTEQWIGQLTVPSFTSLGRPSLESKEFGKVPEQQGGGSGSLTPRMIGMGGRGPGRILSPSENKAGLGVPGRPGTGALGGVRTDLGTIPGTGVLGEKNIDLGKIAQPSVLEAPRIDLGTVPGNRDMECEDDVEPQQQGVTRGMVQSHSFMGSIANMFFGRKGGYT